MGYQGWFNCPNDGTTVGWWHWFTGVDPTVDYLPNAVDYPTAKQCVTTMLDAASNPVNLFSDANPATVETQFAWMQQYGLDGVALQRFSVDLLDTGDARCAQYRARQCPSGGGRQRPRVLRDVRPQRPAQLQAEHCREGLEEARDKKGSPAVPPICTIAGIRCSRSGGWASRADRYSIGNVEHAQIAPQGQREERRRDNHGRRAVVLADGHRRCVVRSRLEEGLAEARRAEPVVSRPFHRRCRRPTRYSAQRVGAGFGGHACDGRRLLAGAVSRLFLRQHESCTGPAGLRLAIRFRAHADASTGGRCMTRWARARQWSTARCSTRSTRALRCSRCCPTRRGARDGNTARIFVRHARRRRLPAAERLVSESRRCRDCGGTLRHATLSEFAAAVAE